MGDLSYYLHTIGVSIAWVVGIYVFLGIVLCILLSVRASRAIVKPHYSHPKAAAPLSTEKLAIPEYWGQPCDPKQDYGLDFDNVQFAAWDGKVLRGWFVPSRNGRNANENNAIGIICAHGGGRDRRAFLRHVPFLHKQGYHVLLYDNRGHGASDGTGVLTHGLLDHEDVLAAAAFVKRVYGVRKVMLMGTSVGAASCIVAAARAKLDASVGSIPKIIGVIAENPFSSISANVRGIIQLTVFWHTISFENKVLFALLWPIMRMTQSVVARQVRKTLEDAWQQNLEAVQQYRAKHAGTQSGRHRTGSESGFISSAGMTSPISTSGAEMLAKREHGWTEWQEPEIAVTHLGPDIPLFLLHGTSDRLIDVHHSQRLFAAAREPKQLWIAPGAKHCALYNAHPQEYEKRVLDFIASCKELPAADGGAASSAKK